MKRALSRSFEPRGRGMSISTISRTRPGRGLITQTVSASRMASSMSCVTNAIVRRWCSQSSVRKRCAPVRVSASSAPNGSSMSSTCGSLASARAIATRCFMPPESSFGKESANPVRPISSISDARLLAALGAADALELRPELDVAAHGHPRIERVGLEHHAAVGAGPVDRHARRRAPRPPSARRGRP